MTQAVVRNQTWGGTLSLDPLVTISKRADFFDQPMGFAPLIPNLESRGKSLHLVGLCFSCEAPEAADQLARDYEAIGRRVPGAMFVILANTETEGLQLSRRGVPHFLANELIFVDDNRFTVRSGQPVQFDAVYNAQFYPFKRHELASKIEKLLLLYKMPADDVLDGFRQRLPKATFANNIGGTHRRFTPEELSGWYARSAVGLCLSESEGPMRVSIEYQLCGLPVVTTPSTGGRDRYFIDDHIRFCLPEPNAVAEAVEALRGASFDRMTIRNRTLRLLAFDRVNFLRTLNKLVNEQCGVVQLFNNFGRFRGMPIQPQLLAPVLAAAAKAV